MAAALKTDTQQYEERLHDRYWEDITAEMRRQCGEACKHSLWPHRKSCWECSPMEFAKAYLRGVHKRPSNALDIIRDLLEQIQILRRPGD